MRYLLTLLLVFTLTKNFAQPDHQNFDQLLKKFVDQKGFVSYSDLKIEESRLSDYLQKMSLESPSSDWSEAEQLTYWINVYNALTLQLVLKYYPVSSIKDIGSTIQIPFINTPWDIKCFKPKKGEEMSLNDIEHGVIRKEFNEPRIHFALVCAATSCPKLRNEAYQASRLEAQLADQTKSFLANTGKNQVNTDYLKLSKIFSWYGGDFRKNGTLIEFLQPYTAIKIKQDAKISFMDYDWSLNGK